MCFRNLENAIERAKGRVEGESDTEKEISDLEKMGALQWSDERDIEVKEPVQKKRRPTPQAFKNKFKGKEEEEIKNYKMKSEEDELSESSHQIIGSVQTTERDKEDGSDDSDTNIFQRNLEEEREKELEKKERERAGRFEEKKRKAREEKEKREREKKKKDEEAREREREREKEKEKEKERERERAREKEKEKERKRETEKKKEKEKEREKQKQKKEAEARRKQQEKEKEKEKESLKKEEKDRKAAERAEAMRAKLKEKTILYQKELQQLRQKQTEKKAIKIQASFRKHAAQQDYQLLKNKHKTNTLVIWKGGYKYEQHPHFLTIIANLKKPSPYQSPNDRLISALLFRLYSVTDKIYPFTKNENVLKYVKKNHHNPQSIKNGTKKSCIELFYFRMEICHGQE